MKRGVISELCDQTSENVLSLEAELISSDIYGGHFSFTEKLYL